jgi:hypothetical protein
MFIEFMYLYSDLYVYTYDARALDGFIVEVHSNLLWKSYVVPHMYVFMYTLKHAYASVPFIREQCAHIHMLH